MRASALVAIFLVSFSVAARAEEKGRARDVTPDPALFFGNFSEGIAFRGEKSVLSMSGRAGFRRTDSRGEHWRRTMSGFVDSQGVEPFANGLCQAPSAPGTVYSPSGAVAGRPVFRTDDFGESWRATSSGIGATIFPVDCAVDPSNPDVLYVLTFDLDTFTGLLFKSVDGGRTFTGMGLPALEGSFAVRVSPTDPRTVFVANSTGDANDGLYVSHDGGATFRRLPASPPLPFRIAPHPTRDGLLFVTGGVDSSVFRSADGGATFAQVGPASVSLIAFDPADASAVYLAAGANGLQRSGDFGLTFTRLAGPAAAQVGPGGVNSVGIAPSRDRRRHIYVGTDRGPYRSDDGGSTFDSISDSFRGAAVNDLAIDASGRLMVAALHTVVAFRAQKAGRPRSGSYDQFGARLTTSQPNPQGEWDGVAVAPSPVDPDAAVVVTIGNGVFSTEDGGASWTRAAFAPFEPFFGSFVRITIAPGNMSRVYLIARGPGLARSDDAGRSFRQLFAERLGAIAVDPTNPDVIYLGAFDNGHGLFKSVNGGNTVVSLGVPGNFSSLAVDPRHPQTVYAGNRAGGVLRSLDAGATWASASSGLPAGREVLVVAIDPAIADRLYAWVKASGVFVSADAGGTWTAAETGESARRTGIEAGRASMAVDPVKAGRVYIGNSGVVQIDTLGDRGGDDSDD